MYSGQISTKYTSCLPVDCNCPNGPIAYEPSKSLTATPSFFNSMTYMSLGPACYGTSDAPFSTFGNYMGHIIETYVERNTPVRVSGICFPSQVELEQITAAWEYNNCSLSAGGCLNSTLDENFLPIDELLPKMFKTEPSVTVAAPYL